MVRESTEFDLLYSQASEMNKSLPESQFKTIASIFVIIGWLLTASSAQQVIRANATFIVPATVVAFSMFVLFKGLWIYMHFKRASILHARLVRLADTQGLSAAVVDSFRPHPLVLTTFFLVNLVVCLAAVAIVWLITR